ncbi:hypothetical protein ZOSMA_154G00280 [Zostera marina]|uniref:Homeobox domain-containing protein n=1 Tax=Zostera marina TaxID=29655 RepID=A0A0K9PVR5_ZOSMR|nr:hypothetical protein ZOSMA_154G00280 [Zostera marina]
MEGHRRRQQYHHHITTPFYHVPQQSRREKLRYPSTEIDLLHPTSTTTFIGNPNYIRCFQQPMFANQTGMSLSLSSSSQYVGTDRGSDVDESIRIAGPSRPSEPFTGYAAVLGSSKFLGPAQQILKEMCSVGDGVVVGFGCGLPGDTLDFDSGNEGSVLGVKSRLVSTLDEVYRRCKQYVQQIQYVMTCFESIAGLHDAAPYASLAIKAMAKHFHRLKNFAVVSDNGRGGEGESLGFQALQARTTMRQQQNLWRHQRGLPENSVAVLKAWLFEHFLHPYPTDTDKHLLAKQSGLSRNQVSNWFINARVRLWKPLVEEIHSLEMRQGRSSQVIDTVDDPTVKRLHNKQPTGVILKSDEFHSDHHHGHTNTNTNTGISLTLGLLHQTNNSKITVPDSLPFNVARRFGLEEEGFNDL